MTDTQEMPAIEVDNDVTPIKQSFADRVYRAFKACDITPFVAQKGKLDYLPWAPAWQFVLETFPESEFEFDEPKAIGSGWEVWVTVRIKDGDNVIERRWWLPVLDYRNQPIAEPTSLQLNNTRMRVLVKCLAMCGLGTELYAGEDVPDKEHDAQAKSTPQGSTLPPEQLFEGRGHIDMLNEALPVDAIKVSESGAKITGYDKERIDYQVIDEVLASFGGKQELKLWVFENLHKYQNRALRTYEKNKLKESKENEPA